MAQLAPGFIGELGRGLPYTGQQKNAAAGDVQDMAGRGTRRRRSSMTALDARNNISPSAQAGTTLSRPELTTEPEAGPSLLPTTNVDGMATPTGRAGLKIPIMQSIVQPSMGMPNAPVSDTVRDMRMYKAKLDGMPDPRTVAQEGVAKRGFGGKLLDTIQGIGSGLQRGGILGMIGGGVTGYQGKLREQELMQKQQLENDRTRANVLQQFNISKAIADQEQSEAVQDMEGRKLDYSNRELAFKTDKNTFDQKMEQAKYALEEKVKTGQLSVDQAKVQLDNIKNQLTAEKNAIELQGQYQGTGVPLPQGMSTRLGQTPGFVLPNKPKEQGYNWQEVTDQDGRISLYNRNAPDPTGSMVNTGITAPTKEEQIKEEELRSVAAERAAKEWMNRYPNGKSVPNPAYAKLVEDAKTDPDAEIDKFSTPRYITISPKDYNQDPEYQESLNRYINESRSQRRTGVSTPTKSPRQEARVTAGMDKEMSDRIRQYKNFAKNSKNPNDPRLIAMRRWLEARGYKE